MEKEQFNQMQTQMSEMHTAICGSRLNPNGLIQRMDKVERYQSKDKKQKWIVLGGIAALGGLKAGWGAVEQFFTWLYA